MNRDRSKTEFCGVTFRRKNAWLGPRILQNQGHTYIHRDTSNVKKIPVFPIYLHRRKDRGIAMVPLAWEVMSPYACFFSSEKIWHKLSTSCQQISIIVRPPRAAPGPLLRDILPLEGFSFFSSLICNSWASTATWNTQSRPVRSQQLYIVGLDAVKAESNIKMTDNGSGASAISSFKQYTARPKAKRWSPTYPKKSRKMRSRAQN